jgi:hypothetical protein
MIRIQEGKSGEISSPKLILRYIITLKIYEYERGLCPGKDQFQLKKIVV